eukprot:6177776-Pleurochrysis_carterae.AAC.3
MRRARSPTRLVARKTPASRSITRRVYGMSHPRLQIALHKRFEGGARAAAKRACASASADPSPSDLSRSAASCKAAIRASRRAQNRLKQRHPEWKEEQRRQAIPARKREEACVRPKGDKAAALGADASVCAHAACGPTGGCNGVPRFSFGNRGYNRRADPRSVPWSSAVQKQSGGLQGWQRTGRGSSALGGSRALRSTEHVTRSHSKERAQRASSSESLSPAPPPFPIRGRDT